MIRSFSLTRCAAAFAMAFALAVPCAAEDEAPTAKLSPEMTVRLILVDRLRSGASKKGDRVTLRVDEDVVDAQGNVLIRKGTPAYGSVTGSRKNGIFGKRGTIDFEVSMTTAIDDQPVQLQAASTKGGKSSAGGALGLAVAVTPLGLLMRGGNAEIQPGTTVIAQIAAPRIVKLPRPTPLVVSNTTLVTAEGVVTQTSASQGAPGPAAPVTIATAPALAATAPTQVIGGSLIATSAASPIPAVVSRSSATGTVVVGGAVVVGSPQREQLPTLETIVLKNGDRVTGDIESLNGGFYTVVTKLGTLRIAKEEVKRIEEAGLVQKVPTLAPKPAARGSRTARK